MMLELLTEKQYLINMETAKEILLKHLNRGRSEIVQKINNICDWSEVLSAMEEYALLKNRYKATNKMMEAQKFVDWTIQTTGKPPTYKQVAEYFGISKTAANYRLRNYRFKMNYRN